MSPQGTAPTMLKSRKRSWVSFFSKVPDIAEAVSRSEPASMSFLAPELLEHLRCVQNNGTDVPGSCVCRSSSAPVLAQQTC